MVDDLTFEHKGQTFLVRLSRMENGWRADVLSRVTQDGGQGGGGLVGTLTGVLAQATQGVRDGANDSGLTNAARGAVTRVTGQAPEWPAPHRDTRD